MTRKEGERNKGEKTGKGKRGDERRSQRWIMPTRGRAKGDKTGKTLFHLSNYIYLSLAHKQTKETNGAD